MRKIISILLLLSTAVLAQVDTGTITGVVKDSSGAVVPSAKISIRNEATSLGPDLATNDAGFYAAPALRPGLYTVTVSKDGFSPLERKGLPVRVQDRIEINFELNVSATATELVVEESAPTLESETSSLGHVVGQTNIQELPLNGRNFSQLAILGAGTLPSRRSTERDSFLANGARPVQNSSCWMASKTRTASSDSTSLPPRSFNRCLMASNNSRSRLVPTPRSSGRRLAES